MSGNAPPGLQRERTALAWDRTGLAFLVVGALLIRVVGPPYLSLRAVPGYLAMLVGAGLAAGVPALLERQARGQQPSAPHPRLLRVVGWASVALSGACLAAVLVVAGRA